MARTEWVTADCSCKVIYVEPLYNTLENHKIIQINRIQELTANIAALQEIITVNNKRYYGEETN